MLLAKKDDVLRWIMYGFKWGGVGRLMTSVVDCVQKVMRSCYDDQQCSTRHARACCLRKKMMFCVGACKDSNGGWGGWGGVNDVRC